MLILASESPGYQAWRDPALDPPALVVQVGKTQLRYHLRCIDDLHAMLAARADWLALGSADEQKPAADGTVEAWGRASDNPVKGWYGIKKGLRGSVRMYVPPVLRSWARPKSSTTPGTIGCARNSEDRAARRDTIGGHEPLVRTQRRQA